ncbi:MAG: hypothetical protein PQJ60_09780, partial [Spirochaetales bacterium]|nr:hypothetical protein [Spirochaetales bacterium]
LENDFLKNAETHLAPLNIEMWEFVLLCSIVVIKDYIKNNSSILNEITKNKNLFIGVGFDGGDIFIVRKR